MNIGGNPRALLTAGLCLGSAIACASAQSDPLAERLVGDWRLVEVCQYDEPTGVPACSPMASMAAWLSFEADGAATEIGSNGASGRFRIERRDLRPGASETLLLIGDRNMGRLDFVGDTLMLGRAYVDGSDRYFVRLPSMGAGPAR